MTLIRIRIRLRTLTGTWVWLKDSDLGWFLRGIRFWLKTLIGIRLRVMTLIGIRIQPRGYRYWTPSVLFLLGIRIQPDYHILETKLIKICSAFTLR